MCGCIFSRWLVNWLCRYLCIDSQRNLQKMVMLIIWQAAIFVFSFPFPYKLYFFLFKAWNRSRVCFLRFDCDFGSVRWGCFLISRRSSSTEKNQGTFRTWSDSDGGRTSIQLDLSQRLLSSVRQADRNKKRKQRIRLSTIYLIFLFLSRIIFVSCVLGSWMARSDHRTSLVLRQGFFTKRLTSKEKTIETNV